MKRKNCWTRRLLNRPVLAVSAVWALAASSGLKGQELPESPLPEDRGFELESPNELVPATIEPRLSRRAIPHQQREVPPGAPRYVPLYRLTRPFYDSLSAEPPPPFLPDPDPSTFREVTIYRPPIGLHPFIYRPGWFELYPYFSLSHSFESNVELSARDEIADTFVTPKVGLELQLGTPDSVYLEGYDTILALNGTFETYADLFFDNPRFSALNHKVSLHGRIGRSSVIWRPFLDFSDVTGSNLLVAELINRTRRIRVLPGIFSEYKITERIGLNHLAAYNLFNHSDNEYIDLESWWSQQEATYRITNDLRVLTYTGFRHSTPSRGYSGSEYTLGLGWMGKPDPRLYSELRIGWGFLDMDGPVDHRRDMSGLRFNGWTTFDWSERFRPTLRYDRDYAYNESDENDNYVSTLIQLRGEVFMGGRWYLTPYLGLAFQEFETSRRVTIQWRPELEFSYSFATDRYPNQSRAFVKGGYMHSTTVKGEGDPIEDWRLSVGLDYKF